jgi:hypothetical protein
MLVDFNENPPLCHENLIYNGLNKTVIRDNGTVGADADAFGGSWQPIWRCK